MDEFCCICLDAFEKNPDFYKHEFCKQEFHTFCIDRWIVFGANKNCPMCRTILEKKVETLFDPDDYLKKESNEEDIVEELFLVSELDSDEEVLLQNGGDFSDSEDVFYSFPEPPLIEMALGV